MKDSLPRSSQSIFSVICALLITLIALTLPSISDANPRTRVKLNGKDAPVFFNDGDSFRVLSGDLKGSKARLAGFNTLESYGAVHSWGDWTKKELYALAKMGTYNAREGSWTCTSDLSTDTYGRYLWTCPDLIVDQIKKGLAHTMSVTSEPASAESVAAQRDAVLNKRGIWAHGVPEYVLTSIHSASENNGEYTTYNRLVSSVDGHSLKWKHNEEYKECQDVCWKPSKEDRYKRFAARWAARSEVSSWIGEYSEAERIEAISGALDSGASIKVKSDDHLSSAKKAFDMMKGEGWVEAAQADIETCMLYVDFRRRFGASRAVCLK